MRPTARRPCHVAQETLDIAHDRLRLISSARQAREYAAAHIDRARIMTGASALPDVTAPSCSAPSAGVAA